jgi:hypothetical protein
LQSIATDIEIEAPVARVWDILTDFTTYPTWNPFIRNISGSQTPGATLAVTIQPEGGRAMSFRPRVQLGEQRTLFKQSEIFSGLLVPLILRGAARRGTEHGFIAMNKALTQGDKADGRTANPLGNEAPAAAAGYRRRSVRRVRKLHGEPTSVALHDVAPASHRIGYVLAPRLWRCGLMSEAVGGLVQWAMSHPEVYRIWAVCDVDNVASARLLESVGMQLEGTRRRWLIHPNMSEQPRDCLCYAAVKGY